MTDVVIVSAALKDLIRAPARNQRIGAAIAR